MTTRRRHVLAATEVKNRFGQVLREIARTGGPIIVERDGRPVAVIVGVEAFERLMPAREKKDRRVLAEAAFGMWSERADIDDTWLERGRARWKSEWENG
jgi:prevent-host-death family protein